jgi:hypothetical protein
MGEIGAQEKEKLFPCLLYLVLLDRRRTLICFNFNPNFEPGKPPKNPRTVPGFPL